MNLDHRNSKLCVYRQSKDKIVMLLRGETGETGENTTALIEPVQVQGAHGKTARPLRPMGHLKRLHHKTCGAQKIRPDLFSKNLFSTPNLL